MFPVHTFCGSPPVTTVHSACLQSILFAVVRRSLQTTLHVCSTFFFSRTSCLWQDCPYMNTWQAPRITATVPNLHHHPMMRRMMTARPGVTSAGGLRNTWRIPGISAYATNFRCQHTNIHREPSYNPPYSTYFFCGSPPVTTDHSACGPSALIIIIIINIKHNIYNKFT